MANGCRSSFQRPSKAAGWCWLALYELFAFPFLATANLSPTAVATSLAKAMNEYGIKRFIRGSKNSGIHLLEFVENDEDEPVTQFARFAPASTSSLEKIPAPYTGIRYQRNLALLAPAVNKALDTDVYEVVKPFLLQKYRGGEAQGLVLVNDICAAVRANTSKPISKEVYDMATGGDAKGKRGGKPVVCPKPPKKPAPPARVTVAPENLPMVAAVNKAAQAVIDEPGAATMMVNTAAWLRKTV